MSYDPGHALGIFITGVIFGYVWVPIWHLIKKIFKYAIVAVAHSKHQSVYEKDQHDAQTKLPH